MGFISQALGELMKFIYFNLAFKSYGLSIIIFTLLTKIALLPLAIKSFKSIQKNQEINPEIQAVQRLYKDDKVKLNEEMQKIYQKHGVSPFAGCLPVLIQLPILFALYDVIRRPLTYIMGIDNISKIVETLKISAKAGLEEIDILTVLAEAPNKISQVADYIKAENVINLNFLGINLGKIPSFNFNEIFGNPQVYMSLLLIPILAALTTYLHSKLTQNMQKPQSNQSDKDDSSASMEGMTKTMGLFMPLLILMFSFNVPAGLGLYWIAGNVIQIAQQLLFNKLLVKKKEGV